MHPSHGITTVDTGFQRPHFDAAYLIVEQGRAAFACGKTRPFGSCDARALAAQGWTDAVDCVLRT